MCLNRFSFCHSLPPCPLITKLPIYAGVRRAVIEKISMGQIMVDYIQLVLYSLFRNKDFLFYARRLIPQKQKWEALCRNRIISILLDSFLFDIRLKPFFNSFHYTKSKNLSDQVQSILHKDVGHQNVENYPIRVLLLFVYSWADKQTVVMYECHRMQMNFFESFNFSVFNETDHEVICC